MCLFCTHVGAEAVVPLYRVVVQVLSYRACLHRGTPSALEGCR